MVSAGISAVSLVFVQTYSDVSYAAFVIFQIRIFSTHIWKIKQGRVKRCVTNLSHRTQKLTVPATYHEFSKCIVYCSLTISALEYLVRGEKYTRRKGAPADS